jgi:acyl-lipid Delta6-acetylenase / acyl-lipid (9-3)-desaturase
LEEITHKFWITALIGWRKAHPAGAHWIDWYDGRDATEVMDAFHSERGRKMYQRLPKSRPETVKLMKDMAVPDSTTQVAFRKLRKDLEQEGFWKRDLFHEAKLLGIWAGLVVTAAITASSLPVVSSFLLGLSMTAAGWLGHDYIHGVDSFADRFRNFAAFAAGLHPTWWSDKHNKHHALSEFSCMKELLSQSKILSLSTLIISFPFFLP